MTVKGKLLGNVALTIVGISVIAGIGLFSITKVKSRKPWCRLHPSG